MQNRSSAKKRPDEHDHDHVEHARTLLRGKGLRITSARLIVLRMLLDNHRPTTTQELIDAVALEGHREIDDVTIYRTVNALVESGIAQTVGTTDRGRRIEVHACDGCRIDHPHLECRRCGALKCMEEGLLPSYMIPTEVAGFMVEEARLYLYGMCSECRKIDKKPTGRALKS